jgi:hypothetical protein
MPLITVFSLLFITVLTLTWRDAQAGQAAWQWSVSYLMSGFFLVFGGFKLLDIPGFAKGYKTYDLLARRASWYGYVYPFIEFGLGLAMLAFTHSTLLLLFEFILMTFSGIGVTKKLLKKEKFECLCLGTIFRIPLTKVTLIEDYGMAILALLLLLFPL